MYMGESSLRLGKGADAGFSVPVDFGGLAGETGTGPSLGILHDAVPYQLLFKEGSCGMGRRLGKALDKVKDLTTERKRDPRARAAGTCVAEDSSPVVIDGDVLPLKGSDGRQQEGVSGSCNCRWARCP